MGKLSKVGWEPGKFGCLGSTPSPSLATCSVWVRCWPRGSGGRGAGSESSTVCGVAGKGRRVGGFKEGWVVGGKAGRANCSG